MSEDEYDSRSWYLVISSDELDAIEALLAFGAHYREEIIGIEIVEEWVKRTRELLILLHEIGEEESAP